MTKVHYSWSDPAVAQDFTSAVSLHSHTSLSRETLTFIPRHTCDVPVLSHGIRRLEGIFRKHHGHDINYGDVWWTPPLTPRASWELECRQIESQLHLKPMVSLSDHDDIEAGVQLQSQGIATPVSVEWTVPMAPVFFHIGLHNIDPAMMPMLAEVTANPRPERIREAFALVASSPGALIILNHPLWDEIRAGNAVHEERLDYLLSLVRPWIHALELNGLRPWSENRRVMELAERIGMPAISGGDRHGGEPNANLNLTRASTFDEFAAEVRGGYSEVLLMPQYQEPIKLRFIGVMCDVLRDQPGSRWSDRIFWRNPDGVIHRLSDVMDEPAPGVIGQFIKLIRFADCRNVQFTLRWALADRSEAVL
ncbi:MAG: hypothetical protein NTV70_18010 [Acidobacteria bacterium]|nr:hypothetical protein [Acidobacteriota bacterium]